MFDETLLLNKTLGASRRVTGWGGRDRTSEWRNQNQLDYSTISTRIWKKGSKRPLAISIAWQPFPNKEGAREGRNQSRKFGAVRCAYTLKSRVVEGVYIDPLIALVMGDPQATDSKFPPAAPDVNENWPMASSE